MSKEGTDASEKFIREREAQLLAEQGIQTVPPDDAVTEDELQQELIPKTDADRAFEVREALRQNVLDAQDAVDKAETRWQTAKEHRENAESILALFDALVEHAGYDGAIKTWREREQKKAQK